MSFRSSSVHVMCAWLTMGRKCADDGLHFGKFWHETLITSLGLNRIRCRTKRTGRERPGQTICLRGLPVERMWVICRNS